jgi:hypothetical protein
MRPRRIAKEDALYADRQTKPYRRLTGAGVTWLVTIVLGAVTSCVGAETIEGPDVISEEGLAPEVTDRSNAALEVAAAAACPTFDGTWQSDEATFTAAIAPATQVDFSKRADGTTPTVTTTVPSDEYLSCCGIRLDYVGTPGGRLRWVGNSSIGLSILGKCPTKDECREPSGIRITFVPGATAAGFVRGSFQTAAMFDKQNAQISTMGPSANFLGYQSAVPIDHAEVKRIFVGGRLDRLVYHRCL